MFKYLVPATAGAFAILAVATTVNATAATVVSVTLWDKGSTADIATDRGVGGTGDMTAATMGLKLSATSVKAGDVTFKVANSSPETIHEMVVFPYKDGEKVPFSDKDAKIDEDMAGHLGEVAELDPGKTGAVTLNLKPGKYILTCNIPGHYMNGMWAMLTVK